MEPLRREWPLLVWAPVEVHYRDDTTAAADSDAYQLLIGIDREIPEGVPARSVIGEVPVPDGWAIAYDALADPRLRLALGAEVAPDLTFRSSVIMSGDHSNTSLVFDDKWVLKLYRRLHEGPNPDVELTVALGRQGLDIIPVPVSVWRRDAWDLAILRRFVGKAQDGMELSRASLDDMLGRRCAPAESRVDIGPDAELLGRTVAELHVGLAAAFDIEPTDGHALAEALTAELHRVARGPVDATMVAAAYERLSSAGDLGWNIRAHGDLHLGQVLRTKSGWTVIDFEGEPSRALEERRRLWSPLRDVAGMIRSFHYASEMACAAWLGDDDDDVPGAVDPPQRELRLLAEAWEERAVTAFLRGYTSVDEVHRLLPAERTSRDALLTLFELDKAIYEVAYEMGHRPELMGIPAEAIVRLADIDRTPRW